MKTLSNIKKQLSKFHNGEDGLEALQVVMIIAIAAIFLIFIKTQWTTIKSWAEGLMKSVTDFKS